MACQVPMEHNKPKLIKIFQSGVPHSHSRKELAHWTGDVMVQFYACWLSVTFETVKF